MAKSSQITKPRLGLPNLGFGLGLRAEHLHSITAGRANSVDWFEIITENYLDTHGWTRRALSHIRDQFPIVMHGVSLSIGSTEPLDKDYLAQVKSLAQTLNPVWISDHLCWTNFGGYNSHDLLPLPLTQESLSNTISRVHYVQSFLNRPLILENPSSYAAFNADEMPEALFLSKLAKATGCGLLLDVNNVYVSSLNHGFDAYEYINTLPTAHIVQIHIAGHQHCGTHIIDTHDREPIAQVWELYQYAQSRIEGGVSTLLEWDDKIPPLQQLVCTLDKARQALEGHSPFELGEIGLPLSQHNNILEAVEAQ